MQEDNVYRRQTVPQLVPADQREIEDKERIAVIDEHPVIKEVIQRLKDDVTFYDTNAGVPDDVLLNPTEFMHTVAGNKKAVASIQREIQILEDLLATYVKS